MQRFVDKQMIKLRTDGKDMLINRCAITDSRESKMLFGRTLMVTDKLQKLNLAKGEIALFSALLLLSGIWLSYRLLYISI